MHGFFTLLVPFYALAFLWAVARQCYRNARVSLHVHVHASVFVSPSVCQAVRVSRNQSDAPLLPNPQSHSFRSRRVWMLTSSSLRMCKTCHATLTFLFSAEVTKIAFLPRFVDLWLNRLRHWNNFDAHAAAVKKVGIGFPTTATATFSLANWPIRLTWTNHENWIFHFRLMM